MSKDLKEFLERGKSLKVLYVEDSEIVRESTRDILDQYFDTCDIAINGEDGFQKYKQFYAEHHTFYDIVITDINMPKMNGIEMIELILDMNREANIIVMSAHNESDYLLQLINLGISNFLLKPIDITLFQTLISRTIESVINQKQLKYYHPIPGNLLLRCIKKYTGRNLPPTGWESSYWTGILVRLWYFSCLACPS